MKRTAFAVLLAAAQLCASAAPADDATVGRLLEVMNARSLIDQSYAQMEQLMRNNARQALGNRTLTEAQTRQLDAFVAKATVVLKEEMNWDRMRPQFAALYKKTFQQEELEGLIAFYSSPVGESFVKKMPAVMQGSMEIAQAQMQRVLPRITQLLRETEAAKP